MNETVWCYQLNESSLVERLLSAVFFYGGGGGGGISLKKSEMRSTLSILLYVNVGVAEIDSS